MTETDTLSTPIKPLSHRRARRKLGTRTHRRSGTNGKVRGMTGKSRAIKRKNPIPRSKKNAVAVWKMVTKSQT